MKKENNKKGAAAKAAYQPSNKMGKEIFAIRRKAVELCRKQATSFYLSQIQTCENNINEFSKERDAFNKGAEIDRFEAEKKAKEQIDAIKKTLKKNEGHPSYDKKAEQAEEDIKEVVVRKEKELSNIDIMLKERLDSTENDIAGERKEIEALDEKIKAVEKGEIKMSLNKIDEETRRLILGHY
jgi:hypothetical protein